MNSDKCIKSDLAAPLAEGPAAHSASTAPSGNDIRSGQDAPRDANAAPKRRLALVAQWVLQQCDEVDDATVADGAMDAPGWFVAMSELRRAARAVEAALGGTR